MLHYVEGGGDTFMYLDNIYQSCLQFYTACNIATPSKDMIAKLLPKLFHTQSSLKYERSMKYTIFKGVTFRRENLLGTNFTMPPTCSASVSEDNELTMTCPIQLVVNGKQQKALVKFGMQNTTITIRNQQFSLGYPLGPSENFIGGLLDFLQTLKFCKGFLKDNTSISAPRSAVTETVSSLLRDDAEEVTRAASCQFIVNWNSKHSACETCISTLKECRKRKPFSLLSQPNAASSTIYDTTDHDVSRI